jgi:hypothetical protein
VLSRQSNSADAPEQTINLSDQVTSLAVVPEQTTVALTQGILWVIVFQEVSTNELAKKLSLFSALTDFAPEDIPSADPADPHQSMIRIASPNQRQEITLKQVSHLF